MASSAGRVPDKLVMEQGVGPSLRRVLEVLGPVVVNLHSAPAGLESLIGEAIIYDMLDPPPIEHGDLVLGVGTALGSKAFAELLEVSATKLAAGVVFRQPAGEALEPEDEPRIAILTIPPEVPWGHFYSLVCSAITSLRQVDGPGIDDATAMGSTDLYGLVNAIAARAGGAALLDDAEFNVLAYSSLDQPIDDLRRQAVLRRRGPGATWRRRFEQDGLHHRLREAMDVVRVDGYPHARPRLVIPVRAGHEVLGYLWVAQGEEPLGDEAEEALREAAPVVALYLARQRLNQRVDRQLLGGALRAVLVGIGSPELLATQLGTVADTTFRVVAFGGHPKDRLTSALRQTWILDLIALHFASFQSSTACVAADGRVYALISQAPATNEARIARICDDITNRIGLARSTTIWCGIGSCVPKLDEAKRSREEADSVLDVLADSHSDQLVASISTMRARVFLERLRRLPDLDVDLASSKLNSLIEHDRDHGTSYVESLRAYLDAHGDFAAAAAAINVHPNTIRYRIRRAADIARTDLSDPDERLVLSLHLRMVRA